MPHCTSHNFFLSLSGLLLPRSFRIQQLNDLSARAASIDHYQRIITNMGGSLDAFKVYLETFKVEPPTDTTKPSTTLKFFQDRDSQTPSTTMTLPLHDSFPSTTTSLPSATIPPFPPAIPTADIPTIDFRLLSAGDPSQTALLHRAATGYGFFYLLHHSVDSTFMFSLARSVFSLPLSEKMNYDMGTTGHYFGYKKSGAMIVDKAGNADCSEFYNISKDEILAVKDAAGNTRITPHPEVITESHEQLSQFMRASHAIVAVIVRELGRSLGLDPAFLPSLHELEQPSADQARVTHAPPVGPATISLGEHTDFGSVTVLFNEGLGGLQVLRPGTREWEYVRPRPECAVINLGDALVKMVGGRLRSAVHRVVGPPGKQQGACERYSVVYFARPNSRVLLRDVFEEEKGEGEGEGLVNADEWIRRRAREWSKGNYKDERSFLKSRGTEHHNEVEMGNNSSMLDKPPEEIEAV